MTTRRQLLTTAAAAALCLSPPSWAQTAPKPYATKVVRIVVAGPPGGGSDTMARLIAAELTPVLGQTVIVDNRAGAGGIIGTKFVADAPADGHTLLLGHVATNAIVPALVVPRPYDPVNDFEPVAQIGTAPDLLVVPAKNAPKHLTELLARAKPDSPLTYGSPGVGLPQHIHGHSLARVAGAPMRHVPYRGSSPALIDVISGHISMMFVTAGAAAPFIKSEQVRALAVASPERSHFFPNVPTLQELGFNGVEQQVWFGIFAPARTPKPVVDQLNAEIVKILGKPDVRAKLEAIYTDIAPPQKADAFKAFVKAEADKWVAFIKKSGITPE